MMKKLSFLSLALVCAMNLLADQIIKYGDLYFSLGTTTATVVKDQSSDDPTYKEFIEVTIPASVTYDNYTYPVKYIGASAFEYCTKLQRVTLPESITTIYTDAFYGCSKLGDINLPEGLTKIYQRAFYNCNLDTITIPSTVNDMDEKVFYGNPLEKIVWKPITCSIYGSDNAPFYNATSKVTSFVFGEQVETIPGYLCKGMSLLDTIVLPPSVKSLGSYAFAYCTNLKSINLPATQKSLPSCLLEGCSSLETIELPATLTTIGDDVFYGCSKLKEINLHEGITTINQRAFYNCKLTSVTIPSTVNDMGSKVFYGNPLEEIVWKPITCSIYVGDNAPFYNATSKVTSFVFGEQVEAIPGSLCRNMSLLDTIVLPPSVKSLGSYAFAYCTNLKSINLPATQKSLPSCLLEGCSSLETIELPATLTTIGDDVFYGCSKLKEINLHEGITTINQRAFYNCKLTSVTIPSTVNDMGSKVFYGNPLEEVVWKPITCSIYSGDNAPFYNATSKVTSFVFGEQVETIPGSLCRNMILLDTIVIPESVTSIGSYAFAYCSALKQFEFPKGIKTVASSVLDGCTNLGEVKIPASVTTIGSDAFYGCKNLTAIYNYAITPQSITANTVYNVNKSTCILYVPMDYINLYRNANVWKEFLNIVGVATELQFEEQLVNVTYLKQDKSLHYMEAQTWSVPHEPYIEGFTFVGWQVQQGMLEDGIVLQAVYQSDDPTPNPSDVIVNPANKAQKLIRQGNVYILQDDAIYTLQGQRVQ